MFSFDLKLLFSMNVENIAYSRAVGTGKGAQGPQIAFRRVNMPLFVFGESR